MTFISAGQTTLFHLCPSLFVLGVSGFSLWWLPGQYLVRADSLGIFGHPRGLPFRRKLVPCSQIDTCEIVTCYDIFGDCAAIQPVFKDRLGRDLLNLDLHRVMPVDQDRLIKYIKARLPKSPFEPWEV